MALEVCQHLRI